MTEDSKAPVIAFGQQPCGFLPRRFLVAKVLTARRLQAEIGGEIVFFYHDSDHDPRETQTTLRHRKTGEEATLNYPFANKLQRKYSPLYLKRVDDAWRQTLGRQLGAYVDGDIAKLIAEAEGDNIADHCLEVYRRLGMLDEVRVVRSSDVALREAACAVDDYFVDAPLDGEVVRARLIDGELKLHEGGSSWRAVPAFEFGPRHLSPSRDSRLRWMQSVLHCTHYIAGAGEQAYLNKADAPEIDYVKRDEISDSAAAWTEMLTTSRANATVGHGHE